MHGPGDVLFLTPELVQLGVRCPDCRVSLRGRLFLSVGSILTTALRCRRRSSWGRCCLSCPRSSGSRTLLPATGLRLPIISAQRLQELSDECIFAFRRTSSGLAHRGDVRRRAVPTPAAHSSSADHVLTHVARPHARGGAPAQTTRVARALNTSAVAVPIARHATAILSATQESEKRRDARPATAGRVRNRARGAPEPR